MIQEQEANHGDKKQKGAVRVAVENPACSWTNRNRFHFNATILGVPQPKTFCIDIGSQNQIGHYHIASYPVVVKTAEKTTSKKTLCHNEHELKVAVSKLSGQDYQVQEWLDEYKFFSFVYSHEKIVIRKKGSPEKLFAKDPTYQKIRGVTNRLVGLLIAGGHKKFELLIACGENATYPLECRL